MNKIISQNSNRKSQNQKSNLKSLDCEVLKFMDVDLTFEI
jgi:hypothetical protein